jgi:TatD DNase family protein
VLAQKPEVVAISEIGLDYVGRMNRDWIFARARVPEYVDKRIQCTAFTEQLRLAKKLKLPVLVHDRTPDYEVLDILEKEENTNMGIAIHSFTNKTLRDAVQFTPLEWLLTETDSPNRVDAIRVAEKIAELKGLTQIEVGEATTQNLRTLIKRL